MKKKQWKRMAEIFDRLVYRVHECPDPELAIEVLAEFEDQFHRRAAMLKFRKSMPSFPEFFASVMKDVRVEVTPPTLDKFPDVVDKDLKPIEEEGPGDGTRR